MTQNYNVGSGPYQPAPNQMGFGTNQFPPFTNIILVDSLEHALRMSTRLHSETVYWNRYKDEIYRIYTDNSGGKQYMVLDVKVQEIPKDDKPAVNTDTLLIALIDKIDKLGNNLEVLNGKYNVKTNDGTNETSSVATEQ